MMQLESWRCKEQTMALISYITPLGAVGTLHINQSKCICWQLHLKSEIARPFSDYLTAVLPEGVK